MSAPGQERPDVLVVGGGVGGVAAALALARRGVRCTVTEPTPWVGGQLTSQAVPPDENRWIEGRRCQGATRSYLEFRVRVRAWYRENRALLLSAASDLELNPGAGWVSRLCCEPRVAHEVLRSMLEPHEAKGLVRVLTGLKPLNADTDGDRVRSIAFERQDGDRLTIEAPWILDATETGDVLSIADVEHAIGAEGADVYGELHGRRDLPPGATIDPLDQQAISWCFAIEHRPGEDHTIPRPERYAFWRGYVPETTPPWTGPLFSWTVPSHTADGRRTFGCVPWPQTPRAGELEMWRYRRIAARELYPQDAPDAPPDVCLVNWVQMDHWLEPLLGVEPERAARALAGAREQSLCLLYWLQTEAPRADGGTGFPGLCPRGEELGTADGFAMAPYIREPRRLLARTVMTEGHVGTEQRRAEGRPGAEVEPYGAGEPFADTVGIGHYQIDLHPSCAGRNNVYVPACPFRIPLGSLVPTRVRNVLAAGKCLGVSHIVNGCTRVHPVEWNVGESAGALAAFCLRERVESAQVHENAALTARLQQDLIEDGIALRWPWDVS